MVHDFLASCIPFSCLFEVGRSSDQAEENLKSEPEFTLAYVYCFLCLMQQKA